MPVPVRGCTWVLSRKNGGSQANQDFVDFQKGRQKLGKLWFSPIWLICKALDQKTIVVSQYCHILNMSLILSSMDVQAKKSNLTPPVVVVVFSHAYIVFVLALFFVCVPPLLIFTQKKPKRPREKHINKLNIDIVLCLFLLFFCVYYFSLLNVPLKYHNYALYRRVARTPVKVNTFILSLFQFWTFMHYYTVCFFTFLSFFSGALLVLAIAVIVQLHLSRGETPSFQGVRVWAVEDPCSSLILQDSSSSVVLLNIQRGLGTVTTTAWNGNRFNRSQAAARPDAFSLTHLWEKHI
jgi:hypothetical protein